jgi:hypothetical protein
MTTDKQIIANQLNSLKSTGPKTIEGKAIVCQNAVKHGILCKEVVLSEEEQFEFDEFRCGLLHQLKPLASLGYLNMKDKEGNKDVIPDPDQRHLIVKMFEMYATGNYSIREITEQMKGLGLKNKQGGFVSHSKIADALKDPFYYGVMRAKGELYPHRHEPIISYELFEKVQGVREGHNKKPFQYVAKPFIFRGMITCGHCGCLVSPEMKKSKYVYYSCTNAKGICKRDYVNETTFLQEVAHYFDDIRLAEETIQEITHYLKGVYESEGKFYQEQKARLRKEQDQIQ